MNSSVRAVPLLGLVLALASASATLAESPLSDIARASVSSTGWP